MGLDPAVFSVCEDDAYEYVCFLRAEGAPRTRAPRFCEAVNFSGALLGFDFLLIKGSARVKGASASDTFKPVVKCVPLTVHQVVLLEALFKADDVTACVKPWRLMTTSKDIFEAVKGLFCQHKPEEHGEGRGKALERTGLYTQPLCELVAKTIKPTVGQVLVPALPLISIQHGLNHRDKEQETPHVSALAGLVELAAVIETDEEAKQLIENVVDL